jgi:hypothetical protein
VRRRHLWQYTCPVELTFVDDLAASSTVGARGSLPTHPLRAMTSPAMFPLSVERCTSVSGTLRSSASRGPGDCDLEPAAVDT